MCGFSDNFRYVLYHKNFIKGDGVLRQHVFSQVPKANIPRSKFPCDHEVKTTFDSGYLVPILVFEVLPADSVNCRVSLFSRLATLISPIMDNLFMDTFFFFVPERLVFGHFQNMLGEQDNPDDSTDYLFPTIKAPKVTGFEVGSLADYFGIPTGVPELEVRAEPFRAYNLIFNTWFRDENLQDSVPFTKDDSGDTYEDYELLRRCKAHGYYTSCLPWPQKGPGVDLPLGGTAPISIGDDTLGYALKGSLNLDYPFVRFYEGNYSYDHALMVSCAANNSEGTVIHSGSPTTETDIYDVSMLGTSDNSQFNTVSNGINLVADLSQAGAVTINAMREAFQVQRWYEALARGGSRYTEVLLNFFGVQSPDARLQRPEYLGGGSSIIQVNVVPQTSASDNVTPQANLSAYAVGVNHKGDGFTKSFVEHGWIIGLVNVRAKLTFQQGLNRMWSRSTKFDLYWPQFAHLGEQAVLMKEIFAQGTDDDNDVWGYQERYAEYRYYPSLITGKFRSSYAQSLDSWHLGLYFEEAPALNDEFIQDNPPVDRVIAVQDEPQVLLDAFFKMDCVRPMPLYSVPGLIDHF